MVSDGTVPPPHILWPALYCIFSTVNTVMGLCLATKSVDLWRNLCAIIIVHVRCRRKESSRSLYHLLMSFLYTAAAAARLFVLLSPTRRVYHRIVRSEWRRPHTGAGMSDGAMADRNQWKNVWWMMMNFCVARSYTERDEAGGTIQRHKHARFWADVAWN